MSLSRYKVSSMEKYDKEITKLSTSIILLQCRRTFRSIPNFLSWKGKLAASTKVKIIPTPLLHSFCSAPPPPKLRASYGLVEHAQKSTQQARRRAFLVNTKAYDCELTGQQANRVTHRRNEYKFCNSSFLWPIFK